MRELTMTEVQDVNGGTIYEIGYTLGSWASAVVDFLTPPPAACVFSVL
jgi:hypothetical protein